MKLLVVGDGADTYLSSFCLYLKQLSSDITIDILNTNNTLSEEKVVKANPGIFNRIYLYYRNDTLWSRIPKIRGIAAGIHQKKVKEQLAGNGYDVAYLAGLFYDHCSILNWLPEFCKFRVASLYGSDFYACKTESRLERLTRAIALSNRIVIGTNAMIGDVVQKLGVSEQKIRKCIFGLQPLELLVASMQTTKEEARQSLGISPDLLVITCGYNAHDIQQHMKIVDAFRNIKQYLPERYILLFPVTYGGGADYKAGIRSALEHAGLHFRMFESYMENAEVVALRKATDIFIQVQTNDASSGSMKEHMFCRNIIITGAWLPYQDFADSGIRFETIPTIDDLPKGIIHVLENIQEIKAEVDSHNTPDKFESSRWPVCIRNWYSVLNEYKNN